jgi:hypothetical protein
MSTSSFYKSSGSTPAVENSIQTAVTQAAGSATQAATSATQANTSAINAQSSLNSFQQYYLGAYSSAPSTTQVGSMYFDTGTSQLYIWSGSSWDVTASANNLQNTDGLTEGSSNLYFTDERVDDRVNALLTAGNNVTLTYDDAANTLTIASTATGGSGSSTFLGLTDTPPNYTGQAYRYLMVNSTEDGIATVTPSTDDISEGTTNLYHTNERVDDRVNSLLTAGSNITLTYNDAGNSLTIASTAAGGGEDYVDIQTTSGTQPSASGTDSVAIGKAAVVGSSATNGISIGSSATVNGASSVSIGLNTSTSTNAGSTALGANAVANAANQLMLGAASGYVGALTSVRVGNSNYTPSNAMDLATKSYVDNNSGSGTSTFTGLTDTPASLGTAGQYLAVNSGATALEFVAAPSGGGGGATILSGLNDVSTATPANNQVLTWDSGTSLWQPITPTSSSSGISLTDLSASNNAPGNATLNYNSSTGDFIFTPPDLSPYLQNINSENLADLSDVNNATPADGQVLTWDNANSYWKPATVSSSGGGGSSSNQSPNIVTGTYTTTSTSFVDAGEIVDTDDGFTGMFEVLVAAQVGTGNNASAWYGKLNVAYNKESPGFTNWMTTPWFGNGINSGSSGHIISNIRLRPRWDTSTNKIYLQVKTGNGDSTVFKWTATLV